MQTRCLFPKHAVSWVTLSRSSRTVVGIFWLSFEWLTSRSRTAFLCQLLQVHNQTSWQLRSANNGNVDYDGWQKRKWDNVLLFLRNLHVDVHVLCMFVGKVNSESICLSELESVLSAWGRDLGLSQILGSDLQLSWH